MPPAPRSEFDLIARYFTRALPAGRSDIALGVGDDCALIASAAGDEQLAVSTDMLIEGVHFLPAVDAGALGHKALAVNLSDLAACGAQPRCFFLALGLPAIDERWLQAFTAGLFALADAHGCVLAGGDTTRAAGLTITITAVGAVSAGRALLRSGARVGDDIWVSGTLGDAALGLAIRQGHVAAPAAEADGAIARLERPQPRVALGRALAGVASAAIDVSDGLVGDLGHVLERSRVGAEVSWPDIPRSSPLRTRSETEQIGWALAGGDDYELLFTAPADRRAAVAVAATRGGVPVSRIGTVTATGRLVVVDAAGRPMNTGLHAFDHFGQ